MTDAASTASVDSLLLDAREAAAICGVSRSHWLAMHSAGRVPLPVRLGRAVRWRRDELRQWIEAGCPGRDRWTAARGAECGR